MRRKKVKSSNIAAIGYDARKKLFEVEFKGGAIYQYKDVPAQVYHKMLNAVSKGSYFHTNIKDAYKGERVDEKGKSKSGT